MGKVWVGALAFAGGVAVGLLIAKYYARSKVTSGIDSFLGDVGLGGGKVQSLFDNVLVPQVV